MRKYTRQQLREMAQQWKAARQNNDPRAEQVVVVVSVMANLPYSDVARNIEQLSRD